MSWQEKIEQHKAKQQREKEEKEAAEKAEKLRVAKEKIPPLLEVLEELQCGESLTQIRNEVWKIGEVSITPNLDEITFNTPLEAKVVLEAQWPVFIQAGYRVGESYEEWKDHLETHVERLIVKAHYRNENEILISIISGSPYSSAASQVASLRLNEPELLTKFEEVSIEDCIIRQARLGIKPPYDQEKNEAEARIIQAIIQRDYKPPKGFGYLLDKAKFQ